MSYLGGCESAFLSTTTNKEAVMYSALQEDGGTPEDELRLRGSRAIMLEIQSGMINRCAEVAVVSQFPKERQFVFPALTALEVSAFRVDRPHSEAEDDQKEVGVLVIALTPTLNQDAKTVDGVRQARKSALEKIAVMMSKKLEKLAATAEDDYESRTARFEYFKSMWDEQQRGSLSHDMHWFLDDGNFTRVAQFLPAVLDNLSEKRPSASEVFRVPSDEHGFASIDLGVLVLQPITKSAVTHIGNALVATGSATWKEDFKVGSMVRMISDKETVIAEFQKVGFGYLCDVMQKHMFGKRHEIRAHANEINGNMHRPAAHHTDLPYLIKCRSSPPPFTQRHRSHQARPPKFRSEQSFELVVLPHHHLRIWAAASHERQGGVCDGLRLDEPHLVSRAMPHKPGEGDLCA